MRACFFGLCFFQACISVTSRSCNAYLDCSAGSSCSLICAHKTNAINKFHLIIVLDFSPVKQNTKIHFKVCSTSRSKCLMMSSTLRCIWVLGCLSMLLIWNHGHHFNVLNLLLDVCCASIRTQTCKYSLATCLY